MYSEWPVPAADCSASQLSIAAPVVASVTTTRPAGWPCLPSPLTVVCQARRGVPSAAQTTSSGVAVAPVMPGAWPSAAAAPCSAGTAGTTVFTAASWPLARELSVSLPRAS